MLQLKHTHTHINLWYSCQPAPSVDRDQLKHLKILNLSATTIISTTQNEQF